LDTPTVREIIIRLEHEGFALVRQNGSHTRYRKGARRVTVSGKMGEHPLPKTYKSICEQAGWL